MKINKIYCFILAITAMVFSSCERDAKNVTIPTIEPKLVVQCFLSPQDPDIRVYVSMSSPIFGSISNEDWIRDADVKITDGVITEKLLFDISSATYYSLDTSVFRIEAGKTYTLYVNTVDGRSAKATCTVPYPANFASLKTTWDTLYNYNADEGNIYRTVKLSIEWNDIKGGKNYYRAGGYAKIYPENAPTDYSYQELWGNTAPDDLMNDDGRDGEVMARRDLQTEVIQAVGGSVGGFSFKVKGIKVYLLSCDENYYKYHVSAINNDSGNPFAEPTLVYSNIQGGLGCFGASNQYINEFDF